MRAERREMKAVYMESTLAGAWYSGDGRRLREELEGYLRRAGTTDKPPFAAVMPHAGYAYSGACAAHGAKALAEAGAVRRVVVVGFSHRIHLPNAASVPSRETHYRSPLGETPLDGEAIAGLMRHPAFADVPATRRGENSVEMQLPLLQAAFGTREWSLVPVTLGQLDDATKDEVADALKPLMDEQTALVASSDFTHYGPNFGYVPFGGDVRGKLRRLDGGAIAKILAGDAEGFAGYCEETGATICGQDSIGVLLRMLPEGFTARELAYGTSGETTGDYENTVSYAALAFSRKEAQ